MDNQQDTGVSAAQTGPSQAEPVVSALRASVPDADRIARLTSALLNFPANGKPALDDNNWDLVLVGFIAEHEVTKPCRNCGQTLTDYRFFKITQAGRLFLAAQGIEARSGETGTGSTEGESPVPEAAPIPLKSLYYQETRHEG